MCDIVVKVKLAKYESDTQTQTLKQCEKNQKSAKHVVTSNSYKYMLIRKKKFRKKSKF